jgi:hypothetical protein
MSTTCTSIASQEITWPNNQIEFIRYDTDTIQQICGSIYGDDGMRSMCTRPTSVPFSYIDDRHIESVCPDCAQNIAQTGVCSELIGTPFDGRDLTPDERKAAEFRYLKSKNNYANYDKYCVYVLCGNEKEPSPVVYCSECQARSAAYHTTHPNTASADDEAPF